MDLLRIAVEHPWEAEYSKLLAQWLYCLKSGLLLSYRTASRCCYIPSGRAEQGT